MTFQLDLSARLYNNGAMNSDKQLIVISDLDGTLLDHYSYQFDAAQPALALLADHQIPLILNSSKTAAEIIAIRTTLHNHQPFIAENGGGIYLPQDNDYRLVSMGKPRQEFLPVLAALKEEMGLSFTGFSDMGIEQLQACTGLSEQECARALQRDFTEPLFWEDTDAALQQFTKALSLQELQVLRGGRFVHVSGRTDKGKAIQWLRNYYQEQLGRPIEIIALGDSENDLQMLAMAEHPFMIRSPVHAPPETGINHLKVSKGLGPKGWNECICEFFEKHRMI